MNDYMWLLKTDKGEFLIIVFGKWTEEEAAGKVRFVFNDVLKLNIMAMIPRKRATGDMANGCTLYENQESKNGLGFDFLAGKNLWHACGRGVEYEAQLILQKNEMKQISSERR